MSDEPTPLRQVGEEPPEPPQPQAPIDIIGILVVCHGTQILLKVENPSSPGVCQVCGTYMQAGNANVNVALRPQPSPLALPNNLPRRR